MNISLLPNFYTRKTEQKNNFQLNPFRQKAFDSFEKNNQIAFQGKKTAGKIGFLEHQLKQDPELKERLEHIETLGFSNLSKEDIFGSLFYNLSDEEIENLSQLKEKYKEDNELKPVDLILFAKFKLTDNQITNYKNGKNQHLTFIENRKEKTGVLNLDELAICCVNDFDETQQARFLELSNKKMDLNKSVTRSSKLNDSHLPLEYIISCVKENKSDFDIKKETFIRELILKDFEYGSISEVANLNEKELEKYITSLQEGLGHKDALAYSTLNIEQYCAYISKKNKLGKAMALEYAKFSLEQREVFGEKKDEFEKDIAIEYAKLTKEQREVFDKNKNRLLSLEYAIKYAKFTEEQREVCDKRLKSKGHMGYVDVFNYAELNTEQRVIYEQKLRDFSCNEAFEYAKLSPKQRKLFENVKNELGIEQALIYAKLNSKQINIFIENKNGLTKKEASCFLKFNPEQKNIFKQRQQDLGIKYALEYTKLTPELREIFDKKLHSLKNEYPKYYLESKCFMNRVIEEAFEYTFGLDKKQQKMLAKQCRLYGKNIFDYAKLADEEKNTFVEYSSDFELYLDSYGQLSEEQREVFDEKINIFNKYIALSYATLTTEQRQVFDSKYNELLELYKACHHILTMAQKIVYDTIIPNKLAFEIIKYAKLNPEQRKAYDEKKHELKKEEAFLYAELNANQKEAFNKKKKMLGTEDAFRYALLTSEQKEKFDNFYKKGYSNDSFELCKLTDEEYEEFKKLPVKLEFQDIVKLSRFSELKKVSFETLEKMPKSFWYSINMNCDEKTQNIIKGAMSLVLEEDDDFSSSVKNPKLNLKSLEYVFTDKNGTSEKEFIPYRNGQLTFDNETGVLTFKDNTNEDNNFSAILKKIGIQNQKKGTFALHIKPLEGNSEYIAYDGAIVPIKEFDSIPEEQFKTWGTLLGGIQSEILSQGASEFIFNLFDENKKTFVGAGIEEENIEPYFIQNKSNEEIKKHYLDLFRKLDDDGKFSAENILRIMPKDCSLSINPYNVSSDGNILYGIETSWQDVTSKTTWKLRIHSTDLGWANNDNSWIARLEYVDETGHHCLKKDGNIWEFNNDFRSIDSHLAINSPIEEKYELLNNLEFQNIIRQISSNLTTSRYYSKNELREIQKDIIQHGLNKELINESRRMLGMFDLNEKWTS